MDTTDTSFGDAVNSALAEYMKDRKVKGRYTFPELAEKTGLSVITIKRLFDDERPFKLGQLFPLAAAMDIDALVALSHAEDVAKSR